MRNALARTLYELAREDERIVVLVADISPAGAMEEFRREFPTRFVNVGVAEQSMIGLAAGLAQRGMRPFCYTIATFALFRAYEFVRCDLAYQDLPVTVVGMGAGLSYSTLGGTHQATEDVAVAMACPNLTVLAPCDPAETEACVRWCAAHESGGPVYLRLGKAGEPVLAAIEPWRFGKLRIMRDGGSPCVLSYGPILGACLRALPLHEHPTVVGVPTLRPTPDLGWVVELYDEVVVVEEASGAPLAALVREAAQQYGKSTRVKSLALPPGFAHFHGSREEILAHVGLTTEKILVALR